MRKTAICTLMGAIVLCISSTTKAGAESIDFDGAKSNNRPGFSLVNMQEYCNTPEVSPAFFPESRKENSESRLRTLTASARKPVIMAIQGMSRNTIDQKDITLLETDSVTIVFNDYQAYFAAPSEKDGDYEIISKTGNIHILKALNETRDSGNTEIIANKNWIKVCRDVIDWAIRIEGGREILVKVVTKVCEEEWAGGGGEGGHIAPGSETHARTNQIRPI